MGDVGRHQMADGSQSLDGLPQGLHIAGGGVEQHVAVAQADHRHAHRQGDPHVLRPAVDDPKVLGHGLEGVEGRVGHILGGSHGARLPRPARQALAFNGMTRIVRLTLALRPALS